MFLSISKKLGDLTFEITLVNLLIIANTRGCTMVLAIQ